MDIHNPEQTRLQRKNTAIKILEDHASGETPESVLAFAVIEQAIKDLGQWRDDSEDDWLYGALNPWCLAAGLEPAGVLWLIYELELMGHDENDELHA